MSQTRKYYTPSDMLMILVLGAVILVNVLASFAIAHQSLQAKVDLQKNHRIEMLIVGIFTLIFVTVIKLSTRSQLRRIDLKKYGKMTKLCLVIALTFCLINATFNQVNSQEDWVVRLLNAAIERTEHQVRYDGSYRSIQYPGGDVPDDIGVCTDLIIRSYRAIGVDIQKNVHEDMSSSFSEYPSNWGLSKPDPNIDHRRVLNLQAFFRRCGKELRISEEANEYLPGDIVTWMLPGNIPHIGIVTDKRSPDGTRPLIVHNIGRGPEVEDCLFKYTITGHYRYSGS